MGWLSAGDSFSTLQGRLRFPSEKAAISFVKDKGGDVIMAEQLPRRSRPRNYLDNFRIIRPEDEEQSRFAPEAIP